MLARYSAKSPEEGARCPLIATTCYKEYEANYPFGHLYD